MQLPSGFPEALLEVSLANGVDAPPDTDIESNQEDEDRGDLGPCGQVLADKTSKLLRPQKKNEKEAPEREPPTSESG